MYKFSSSATILIATFFALAITFIDFFLLINFTDIGDRINYLTFADNIDSYFVNLYSNSLLTLFRQEPFWSLVFYLLNWIGLSSIASIRLIIFISSFIAFFIMIDKNRIPLYALIFIIFFDWFIGNYVNALRMAFATSIFLFSWFYLKGIKQKIIWALTPLVHYSFFILLGLVWLESYFKKIKLSVDISVAITFIAGVSFGLLVFIAATFLGFGNLSDRYSEFEGIFSLSLGPIFFLFILIIFLLQDNEFKQKNLFSIMVITFYIASVIFFPPISRILISSILLVLISGFSIKSYYKFLFIIMIFMYTSYFLVSGKLYELLFPLAL